MPQVKITDLQDTFIKAQWRDGKLYGSDANTNFNRGETASYLGCGVYLDTGTDPDTLGEAIALIKAETSQWSNIPPAAVIDSAWLHIFTLDRSWYQTKEYARISSGALYGDPWDENTATWNNVSKRYYDGSSHHDVRCYHGRWASFNVVWWVRRARDDSRFRRTGLILHSYDNNSTRSRIDFASRNYHNEGLRPYITVNYHIPELSNDLEAAPNNAKTAIVITGSGLAAGGRAKIEVSSSSGGPFSHLGYGDPGPEGRNYSFVHEVKAPAPTQPTINSITQDGAALSVDWTGSSQGSVTRYYRARRESGGELSGPTNVNGATLTPDFRYILERRRVDPDNNDPWRRVYSGNNTSYRDTDVNEGVEYQYRVYAVNGQGTQSPAHVKSGSVIIPDPPSITSITTPDNNRYRIEGTGAFQGGKIRVYYGGPDATFRKGEGNFVTKNTPDGGSWSVEIDFPLSPPNKPSIKNAVPYEDSISLSWEEPGQPGISRNFAASRINANGIESRLTGVHNKDLKPQVQDYKLERRLKGANQQFEGVFPNNWSTELDYSDNDLVPDTAYIYRLTARNSANLTSVSDNREVSTLRPAPPTMMSPQSFLEEDGSYYVRVRGKDRDGAGAIKVYRRPSGSDVWSFVGNAQLALFGDGSEFRLDDVPDLERPDNPTWSRVAVDLDGVHLRWTIPENPPSTYNYRATRVVKGKEGQNSSAVSVTISPTVSRIILQRQVLQENGTYSGWTNIPLPQPLSTSYTDADVDFSSVYRYRLIAVNDREMSSAPVVSREVTTANAPPPPPPEEPPPPPEISSPEPSGVIPFSGGDSIRVGWRYYDPGDFPQSHYRLRLSGGGQTLYWNATSGSWQATEIYNQSPLNYAAVASSAFQMDTPYELELIVRSSSGVSSAPLSWSLHLVLRSSRLFDLNRRVRRSYARQFDLYRKVNLVSEGEILHAAEAGWEVEGRKPLVVSNVGWEGGGNAFPWVVYDRDGRPEPYAELDFVDSEGNTTTFRCDERGRIVLRVPDDIRPGIYRLRERGPSMAPRTTENFVVYDPWLIYRHGHRHAADGPDPIYGITRDQIADDANISPSQIEGGSSLMQLVDRFGPDILAGLERHLSSGHGNYVVEGLNHSVSAGSISVSAGLCWEGGRLRSVPATELSMNSDGVYRVYVREGSVLWGLRDDHPPGSCPLYTVTVTGGSVSSVRDDRLRHPSPSQAATATSVTWGPSLTNDVLHNGSPLSEILDPLLERVERRLEDDERLRDEFYARNLEVERSVQRHSSDLDAARLALLHVGRGLAVRTVYSLLEGISTLNPPNLGVFASEDELSGLSTISVRDGVGVLPEGWSQNKEYLLRTLRVYGAPSRYLEFHLFYEDTGGIFQVRGSLGTRGSYRPVSMNRISVSSDTVLIRRAVSSELVSEESGVRTLEEVVEESEIPLRIATYRASFAETGDEAVVELVCRGGSHPDGVRIRGWAVVMA